MYGGAAAAARQLKLRNTPYQVGLNRRRTDNVKNCQVINGTPMEFWFGLVWFGFGFGFVLFCFVFTELRIRHLPHKPCMGFPTFIT